MSATPISATGPRAALQLKALGNLRLHCFGSQIVIKSRKGLAIIAYLALSEGGRETRERLSGLLWSNSEEDKARGALRQCLHAVREALSAVGFDAFTFSRDAVELDRQWVVSDVDQILQGLSFGRVSDRLLQSKGLMDSVLSDLDDLDPAFDGWVRLQRQLLQRRFLMGLETHLSSPDRKLRSRAANAMLLLDPVNEAAARTLMLLHAAVGDIAAALQVYESLWNHLDRDFGMEPSEQTQEVAVAVKLGTATEQPSVPAQVLTAPRPVAEESSAPTRLYMAPFDDAGVSRQFSYLVNGFRHGLISKLVRFRQWSVLEGEFDPGATGPTAPRPAYSVNGTVRQLGDALHFTITVKERPSGRYVWSESFEMDVSRFVAIELQVTSRIATALNVHLSPRQAASLDLFSNVPANVHELWLKGHQLLASWRIEDREAASTILHRVVDLAPGFAPAYDSLVRLYNSAHIVLPGVARDRTREERALGLARTACALDPLNSRSHLGLGWSLAMNGFHDEAQERFRMALDLNDSDPWTLISSAQGLSFCGEHDVACSLADRALDVDPRPSAPSTGYHVGIRYLAGQDALAVRAAELAGDVISNLPAWLAAALAQLGRYEEANLVRLRFLNAISAIWHGLEPATPETTTQWLLSSFPLRREVDRERLRSGLNLAGFPAGPGRERTRSAPDRLPEANDAPLHALCDRVVGDPRV